MPEFYLRSKFLSIGCYRDRSLLRPAEKARPRILCVLSGIEILLANSVSAA
jgi:hypothetical protein